MAKKWAALFPGQGSQHLGMGKELFDNFKVAQQTFEEASDAVRINLKKLCFEGPEAELRLTANTQPALLVTSISAWRVFTSECPSRPFAALGHSLGEYSALVASEAMSLADAITTVRLRGLAMQEAVPVGTGGMMAVMGMTDELVVQACKDFRERAAKEAGLKNCVIEAANFNSPGQVVVSGHEKALQFMKDNLSGADYGISRVKMIPLAVSAPFHCSLMKPAAERLKPKLESIAWNREMKFGVIHNVNALMNYDGEKSQEFLYNQITKPVLWTESMNNASRLEVETFVEVGAGKVLTGLTKKILPQGTTMNIDGLESFKQTSQTLADFQ